MHILIVSERFCDALPERGLTNSEHTLWGSLETSGLATQSLFHYDDYVLVKGLENPDNALMEQITEDKPDLIVISYMAGMNTNPTWGTIADIRDRLGIPVVIIWWDALLSFSYNDLNRVGPSATLNVVVDTPATYKTRVTAENTVALWCPQDSSLFHDPGRLRDIDVSFIGSTDAQPVRKEILDELEARGIKVHVDGGHRQHRLSPQDYAKALQRSKLTINFSRNGEGEQCKARVFEATMCGAMLLEQENNETRRWLAPGGDYREWNSVDNLAEQIAYYLDPTHEAERQRIALAGRNKSRDQYNSREWWTRVLELVAERTPKPAPAIVPDIVPPEVCQCRRPETVTFSDEMISIILPSLREPEARAWINHLALIPCPYRIEIVLVSPFVVNHPLVHWIEDQGPHEGTVRPMNLGAANANGDYIAVASDDAQYGPNWWEIVDYIKYELPAERKYRLASFTKVWVWTEDRRQRFIEHPPSLIPGTPIVMANWFAMDRATLELLGGQIFRPEFHAFHADPDLTMRLHEAGEDPMTSPAWVICSTDVYDGVKKANVERYLEQDGETFSRAWEAMKGFKHG